MTGLVVTGLATGLVVAGMLWIGAATAVEDVMGATA